VCIIAGRAGAALALIAGRQSRDTCLSTSCTALLSSTPHGTAVVLPHVVPYPPDRMCHTWIQAGGGPGREPLVVPSAMTVGPVGAQAWR